MKKQLVIGLGLAVIAAPSFASKARLQALGEDIYGSQYIDDNRNIFLNASELNNYGGLVTYEWGSASNATDAAATPRAEGGVFFEHGNLVYGVQLGEESNSANSLRTAAGLTAYAQEENNIDLFVAGDAGVKWGASLLYGKSKDETGAADAEQSSTRVRLGVDGGMWDAFANVSLANKAEDAAGNEFKGDMGYQLGGSYQVNHYTIFAQYRTLEGENAADQKLSLSQMTLGVGRNHKLNDKATLFTKLNYTVIESENESAAAGNTGHLQDEEFKTTVLPLTIGLEYDATSWLTFRGSVAQNIMGDQEGSEKKTIAESAVVNAGASLKFGDLSVDGVIGNNTGAASAPGENTAAGNGQLRTDSLMSRVSMTYRF